MEKKSHTKKLKERSKETRKHTYKQEEVSIRIIFRYMLCQRKGFFLSDTLFAKSKITLQIASCNRGMKKCRHFLLPQPEEPEL